MKESVQLLNRNNHKARTRQGKDKKRKKEEEKKRAKLKLIHYLPFQGSCLKRYMLFQEYLQAATVSSWKIQRLVMTFYCHICKYESLTLAQSHHMCNSLGRAQDRIIKMQLCSLKWKSGFIPALNQCRAIHPLLYES